MAEPREVPGTLFIVGGGKISDDLRQRFVDFAGGKKGRLVVIPTASEYADRPNFGNALEVWRRFDFESLEALHTRDRSKAMDPEFSKSLEKATAVWFGGGDQSRIMAAYHGTIVESRLFDLLRRGGVIGGTSAGAAIQTKVMITGGRTKASVGSGFDFLPCAVVDQHFLARSRQDRLMGVLKEQPRLIGFGIDEGTALIARGRALEAAGASVVTICLAEGHGRPAMQRPLKPGERADLFELASDAALRDAAQR